MDDPLVEDAENVVFWLAASPAYVVVVPGIAGLSIADDDLGAVTITRSGTAGTGSDSAYLTVSVTSADND